LVVKKQLRMRSAMAFIKSGGTLFPTLAPRVVANFPDRRFMGATVVRNADSAIRFLL